MTADTSTTAVRAPYTDAELDEIFVPVFDRVAEGVLDREERRELPYEPVKWLREAGFGRLRLPQSHGGFGVSIKQLFRLFIRLAEADSNLTQIFRQHFAFVEDLNLNKDPIAQQKWFPRVRDGDMFGAATSEKRDSSSIEVAMVHENGRALLTGRKDYCTGTIFGDWISTLMVDGDKWVIALIPTKAEGVSLIDDWDGFGQRLTASGSTLFDRVEIKDEYVLRRIAPDDYFQGYLPSYFQLTLIATMAGIAHAALRDTVKFVQGRTRAFGVTGVSSPRHDPLVQRIVGRIGSIATAIEALVNNVSDALDRLAARNLAGACIAQDLVEAELKTYEAQQIAIGLVLEATGLMFEVGGASQTSTKLALDRHWRNARTLASHNPATFRERAIGDYYLNGAKPGMKVTVEAKASAQEAVVA